MHVYDRTTGQPDNRIITGEPDNRTVARTMTDFDAILRLSSMPPSRNFTQSLRDAAYTVSTYGLTPHSDKAIERFFDDTQAHLHIVVCTPDNVKTFSSLAAVLLAASHKKPAPSIAHIGWIARFRGHIAMGSLTDPECSVIQMIQNLVACHPHRD